MRLFLVISLAIALQGCSSTAPVAEPVVVTSESTTTTTAVDPTTTLDPEAADRAEIEDVLTGFYGYVYDVGFVAGTPGLEKVATSPVLETMQEQIGALASTGHSGGEGSFGLSLLELELGSSGATATVCILDEAPLLNGNGDEVTPRTPDPFIAEAFLLPTATGWRVSTSLRTEAGLPCELQ